MVRESMKSRSKPQTCNASTMGTADGQFVVASVS